jgi:TolB protein
MVPRLASAVVLPALVAGLLALVFSSGGSARVGSGSSRSTFPGRNGAILFERGTNLYLMRPDGTHQRRITNSAELELSARWSPDGKWIAIARGPHQLCPQAYLMRADGTGLRRLTHARGCYTSLAWSPDGQRIGFLRDVPVKGNPPVLVIGTIKLNGSGLKTLTDGKSFDVGPKWSPDGTTVAFARGAGSSAIWLMNTDGTNQRQLTHPYQLADVEQDEDTTADWSPDGKWIAFSRSHEPHEGNTGSTRYRADIYLIHPDGTGLRRLTRLTNNNVSPAWSPDGKRIVFASDRGHDDVSDIYVMNADGTKQTRLTADSFSPDWQPLH